MRLCCLSWWLLGLVLLENVWWACGNAASMEANLLTLMGLRKRPQIDKSKVVIPQVMLDSYHRQRRVDSSSIPKPGLHTKSANTVRSFTHVESPIDMRFPGHHKFRLKFDITSIPLGEEVKAAELAINRDVIDYISEDADEQDYLQQVLVNDIIKPGVKGKRDPIVRLVDSKTVDIRKGGLVSLDVLPAVVRWMERPSSNYGLVVQIATLSRNKTTPARHVRIRRDVGEEEVHWASREPVLVTYTDDGKNKQLTGEAMAQKRSQRAISKKHRTIEKRNPCKRHPMYVDFNDVGWNDWIVAPPGYDAYYCHGECNYPLAEHLNTTNHAIVQTLANSVNAQQVPKACCVPTQLTSISILYLNEENKLVLKNYNKMTVVGCGCR